MFVGDEETKELRSKGQGRAKSGRRERRLHSLTVSVSAITTTHSARVSSCLKPDNSELPTDCAAGLHGGVVALFVLTAKKCLANCRLTITNTIPPDDTMKTTNGKRLCLSCAELRSIAYYKDDGVMNEDTFSLEFANLL